jgi:hypothetical protein
MNSEVCQVCTKFSRMLQSHLTLEVCFIAAIVSEANVAAAVLGSFGLLTIVLAFALLTLIFFRTAYRRSAPPLKTI